MGQEIGFEQLEERLRRGLAGAPPGTEAQILLAPRPRIGWDAGRIPEDARPGAGLLLLYPRARIPYLVLTLRHAGLSSHAGQVSLPGGAIDPGESITEAALREAREEIGVDPSTLEIAGLLTPLHIPVSGFVIRPVVALRRDTPRFVPAEREVERILEVPFRDLIDPEKSGVESRFRDGREFEIPFLCLEGEKVWGATAMILAELLVACGYRPAL